MGGRANMVAGINRNRQTGFKMEKMFRLVMKAIQLFGPGGGATASQITSYIQSAHRVALTSRDLKEGVKESLKKGIAGGVLRRRNVDGKYYVCPRTAAVNPKRILITKILRRVVPAGPTQFRQQRRGVPPDFPVRQPRMRTHQIPELSKSQKYPVQTGRKLKERSPVSPMNKACVGHTPLPERKRRPRLSSFQNGKMLRSKKEKFKKEKKMPRPSPMKKRDSGVTLRGQTIRSPRNSDITAGASKETDESGRDSKTKNRTRPKRISLTRKTNPANPASRPPPPKSPTKADKTKKPEAPNVPSTESTNQSTSEKTKPKN